MKVELKSVSKTIRKVEVIKNVSFSMESGMVYGLKGVNGSGKTMLMRLISGLICPTSGEILINGEKLGQDISFPKDIGILIENPAFLDNYTGIENLELLAEIQKKVSHPRIEEVLSQVGLSPNDRRKYKQYSLGMKQRLGIAGAVLEHPKLLLIDEPTNALDTTGIEMVKNIISEERDRGALIVLACHDFTILNEISDKIYFVEEGQVKAYENSQGDDDRAGGHVR